jgi:hypothetical protein
MRMRSSCARSISFYIRVARQHRTVLVTVISSTYVDQRLACTLRYSACAYHLDCAVLQLTSCYLTLFSFSLCDLVHVPTLILYVCC